MKAIETEFDGYLFRSRTEARWAVFLKTAGIKFDYEPQGFVLDGMAYLPDFWLPQAKSWLEIKGADPTEAERELCQRLAVESGNDVLLAVGAPTTENQITVFRKSGNVCDRGPYSIGDDRRNDGEFWLMSEGGAAEMFIALKGAPDHDCYPVFREITGAAYLAAKSARFEYGESGARKSPAKLRSDWCRLAYQ